MDDRQSYYANVLSELHACGSYVQLRGVCVKFGKSPHAISICSRTTFLPSNRLASKLMPRDVSENTSCPTPVSLSADRNCLPRSGSVLAFGNGNFEDEIQQG